MKKLAYTKDNIARVKALKRVPENGWEGETIHDTMDKCLVSINLYTGLNSGFYTPSAVRIDGIEGWFMINQDGTLNCEARVVEVQGGYKIQYMTTKAWNGFERDYSNFID